MAVHLRLQRYGARKAPFYRIVATDSRVKREGAFLEQLGTYDPMKDPAELRLKADRVDYWLSVGAQASDTVASLIRRLRREAAAGQTPAS